MTLMQRVAAIFGVTFVLVGALGFTVTGFAMPGMGATMESAPRLFGLFPLNVTHNLVHLAIGLWGLLAARGRSASLSYAFVSGVLYAVLAGVGAFWPTLAGIVPIGGYDVGLHLAVAVVLIGCAVYSATTDGDAAPATASSRG